MFSVNRSQLATVRKPFVYGRPIGNIVAANNGKHIKISLVGLLRPNATGNRNITSLYFYPTKFMVTEHGKIALAARRERPKDGETLFQQIHGYNQFRNRSYCRPWGLTRRIHGSPTLHRTESRAFP